MQYAVLCVRTRAFFFVPQSSSSSEVVGKSVFRPARARVFRRVQLVAHDFVIRTHSRGTRTEGGTASDARIDVGVGVIRARAIRGGPFPRQGAE